MLQKAILLLKAQNVTFQTIAIVDLLSYNLIVIFIFKKGQFLLERVGERSMRVGGSSCMKHII